MQTLLYTKVIERLRHYPWRRTFESAGLLKGLLLRGSLVVTGHYTVELGLAVCHLSKQIMAIKKSSGLLFVALYLKQSAVILQRYYALQNPKKTLSNQKLEVAVSLSRSGLPRIIPSLHRKRIALRDSRADYLVRIYLTWFSLAKVIALAKPLRAASFRSITDPPVDVARIRKVTLALIERFNKLVRRYLPRIRERILHKGLSWVPTWKVPPNKRNPFSDLGPSIFASLNTELDALSHEDEEDNNMFWVRPVITTLAEKEDLFPLDHAWNDKVLSKEVNYITEVKGSLLRRRRRAAVPGQPPPHYGRVSAVVEGAGKRRLFCIGNYVRQRVLAPFHYWIMDLLRTLPQDGTFDQEAPLQKLRLFRPAVVSSYDLKSATDRFPVVFSSRLIKLIFGFQASKKVVDCCLASAPFTLGPPVISGPPSIIQFGCGQPLGYYGSWALFSLSHHFLVWLAADDIYPDAIAPFRRYALLGDDIVIADILVARRYRWYLKQLGVSISIPKSIISDVGCLEFAKRYWVKNLTVDCSPVSLKSLLAARTSLAMCAIGQKYKLPLNLVLRLGGAGYRVRSRGAHQTSTKWKRLVKSYTRYTWGPELPLEWWMGGGKPLSNYVHMEILSRIQEVFKPKDLILPPWYNDENSDLVEIEERRLLHGWMSMWLKASLAYYKLLLSEDTRFQSYFDLPLVQGSWKAKDVDEDIFKYGLFWKFSDQAVNMPPYLGRALTPLDQMESSVPAMAPLSLSGSPN